jgi:hypothetical protein
MSKYTDDDQMNNRHHNDCDEMGLMSGHISDMTIVQINGWVEWCLVHPWAEKAQAVILDDDMYIILKHKAGFIEIFQCSHKLVDWRDKNEHALNEIERENEGKKDIPPEDKH